MENDLCDNEYVYCVSVILRVECTLPVLTTTVVVVQKKNPKIITRVMRLLNSSISTNKFSRASF